MPAVSVDRQALARFCEGHRIRELSFFGSVLRSDFGPESDVDVLVEFEPGATVSLFDLTDMELELEAIVRRKVDLVAKDGLRGRYRDHILASLEIQYVAPR